jgi:hypothetical protein
MGEPTRPTTCTDKRHRIIQLGLPHAEARVIRARLAVEIGPDRVSALRKSGKGWLLVICRDCARRDTSTAWSSVRRAQ